MREIAAAFDRRNGSDYFSQLMERHRELMRLDWGNKSKDDG